ncbi:MAG TPA: hypothetical protein VGC22_01410 [Chitinophaga sp.]
MGEFLSANTLTIDTILHLTEENVTAPDPAIAALDVIIYAFALPAPALVAALPDPAPEESLAEALSAAFNATDAHAGFIFESTFKNLLLAQEVGNRGIVLEYDPAGDINTVEQQLYATLSSWNLPSDQLLVQDISQLIYRQAASTGNTPLATYGQSATPVMRVEGQTAYAVFACWVVALATFPLGGGQTALLYSFKAATTELSAVIV